MSDDDEPEGLTGDEAAMLMQGLTDLGTIDALMTAVQQTLLRYPSERVIAAGIFARLLDDAANLVLAWQALRASPFGAMLDPRVIGPDDA